MRIEKDIISEISLDDNTIWGINTQRALENFGQINEVYEPLLIKSYLMVKKACAKTNFNLGYLQSDLFKYIDSAIDDLLYRESYTHLIPINPLSGGAGTSLNMNLNEIIANKALEKANKKFGDYDFIHPLHHINLHQSTNDTYPSALKIAILFYLKDLEESLVKLQTAFQQKEKDWAGIIKLGRTELQDALPITVGMQFSAYSETIARDRWRIFKARERIKVLNIGGTAIGTGFNAPQKYIFKVIEELKNLTGLNITRAENMIDATQNLDSIVEVSGLLKTTAVNFLKISEDLRLLSSGPDGGFNEYILPAMQEGSTIMPGKTNPVILEFISQNALLIMGNDNTISHASGLGNLELNQFLPLISHLILKNLKLLLLSANKFTDLILNLKINQNSIKKNLTNSIAILTYLSQYIGYEKASEVYAEHTKTSKPVKDIILDMKLLEKTELDNLLSSNKICQMGIKK